MPVSRQSGSPRAASRTRRSPARCVTGTMVSAPGQQMKAVVRQPHPESEWHQRIRVIHGDLRDRALPVASQGSPRVRAAPPSSTNGDHDQRADEQHRKRRRFGYDAERPRHHGLDAATGRGHPERVQQAAEHEDHRQRGDVPPLARIGRCPIGAAVGELRAGHARRRARCCRAGTRARSRGRACSPCCRPSSGRNSRSSQPR